MHCVFNEGVKVFRLLKFISQFETNVKLECSENGITMFTMSNCHSVFIDVVLPVEYFKEYRCESPVGIGVNLNVLLSALSSCKGNDLLSMDSSNDDKVTFTKMSEDESIHYVIKQMNIDHEIMNVPEMDENVTVQLSPSYLRAWKKNIIDFTKSSLTIDPTDSCIRFNSTGDGGDVNMEQKMPSNGIEYTIITSNVKPLTIGNKNVMKAFTIGDVSDTLDFGWANTMPFRISATLGECGTLRVFLAPLIEDEEMEAD